jgi:hypothetical protein
MKLLPACRVNCLAEQIGLTVTPETYVQKVLDSNSGWVIDKPEVFLFLFLFLCRRMSG